MAADAWKIYDSFKEAVGNKAINLDTDTFKCALFTSSLTPAQTDDTFSATNEATAGTGYTAGGYTMVGVSWTDSGGTLTFDATDVPWTASGGQIVARYAIIYDTTASNQLVAMCLLDNAPADVTVTDGNTLTLQFNASGILTLSGGW